MLTYIFDDTKFNHLIGVSDSVNQTWIIRLRRSIYIIVISELRHHNYLIILYLYLISLLYGKHVVFKTNSTMTFQLV